MQRAGGDEKDIALVDRHSVEHLGQGIVADSFGKLVGGDGVTEAVIQEGVRLGIQHHPHLGFAILALVGQSVVVGGVDLNGQVLLGVNELDKDRELLKRRAVGSGGAGVGGQIVRQGGAVRQNTGAVGVGGEHPGLGQRVQVAVDVEIGSQPVPAPKVVFAGREQFESTHDVRLSHFFFSSRVKAGRKAKLNRVMAVPPPRNSHGRYR